MGWKQQVRVQVKSRGVGLLAAFSLFELQFLAHHTVRSMMGYWRDNVVCLSVHLSVCDAMHRG